MTTQDTQIIFGNKTDVFARFTGWLKSLLSETKGAVSIALSGGNTPKALFDFWVREHRHDIGWERLKFFWGDERCVPPDDAESNYRMAKERLFDRLPILPGHIFRIEGENDPQAEAKRYSNLLCEELPLQDGIPSFDIVMLGMGDDGHTASIFPNQIALWDSPKICVVGVHPQSGQKRVSLSGTTIDAARNVAFLVTGKSKAEKVKEIIENRSDYEALYPAAKAAPKSGSLLWFLDDDAAELIIHNSR